MANAIIKFEPRPVEDRAKTMEKGYYCTKDVDFATIHQPGDRYFQHEVEVTPELLEFWQNKPALRYRVDAYTAWKAGMESPVEGTALREWPLVSSSQIGQLASIGVKTVEQLADLSEQGIMAYGMGGRELKAKAQSWISLAEEKGRVAARLAEQEAMIANERREKADLQELVKSMASRLEALETAKKPAEKK